MIPRLGQNTPVAKVVMQVYPVVFVQFCEQTYTQRKSQTSKSYQASEWDISPRDG